MQVGKSRSFTTNGIVLSRRDLGETDRLMSLLSEDRGKIAVIAKGVRKLQSTQRAFLEPGNYVRAFLIETKSLPYLTQTQIIDDCSQMSRSLASLRALSQILEIFDRMFVEEELEPSVFELVLKLRTQVVNNQVSPRHMRELLGELISQLGYQHPDFSKYSTIAEYVSALTDKPVRSFEFLMVK